MMITIWLSKQEYAYDVHSLVKSFYPTEEVKILKEGEQPDGSLCVRLVYEQEHIAVMLIDAQGEQISWEDVAITAQMARSDIKNKVKDVLYRQLSAYTGQELPWGDMTGIRPTKFPMALLYEGWSNAEIAKHLREEYHVSVSRSALAITIANREKHLIDQMDARHGYSLYMGIPFCPTICLYCSFSSSPIGLWRKRVDTYLDALCHEMDETAKLFAGKTLQTVYMGGGTPTTLEPAQMDRVLTHAKEVFDFSQVREFTVEAGRPDTITREKLEVMKKHGVTRISINPQTMNQKTLDLIGRHHTVEEIIEKFNLARELGFDNINMDLIVGLPGEGMDEVRHTMEEVAKLSPDSITVHSLALKRAARLNLMKDVYEDISFNNTSEMMDMTTAICREAGLAPYYLYRQKNMAGNFENVGYAKEGKEGLYNILIMEEVHSNPALGAGTVSKAVYEDGRIERCDNVKDIQMYVDRIEEMIERKRVLFCPSGKEAGGIENG